MLEEILIGFAFYGCVVAIIALLLGALCLFSMLIDWLECRDYLKYIGIR